MADGEAESAGSGAMVVVDPEARSRSAAEDLEDDLDRHVFAVDSMDFDMQGSEEILDAEVFIISWDLGFRSGADLLEELRENSLFSEKKVLIATEAPTRALVFWAMALGADGVVTKPYDAAEIRAQLDASAEGNADSEAAEAAA